MPPSPPPLPQLNLVVPTVPVVLRGPAVAFHLERFKQKYSGQPASVGFDVFGQSCQDGPADDDFLVETGLIWSPVPLTYALVMTHPDALWDVELETIYPGNQRPVVLRVRDVSAKTIREAIEQKHPLAVIVPQLPPFPQFVATTDSNLVLP